MEVDAARFGGWVERFAARNGGTHPALSRDDDGRPVLTAADGTRAIVDSVFDRPDAYGDVPGLVALVGQPHPYALLLVRRGGWAVALADGTRIGDSRVGTRYVQGKTKAGGWSQQRYARRRSAQTEGVVAAAAEAAAWLLARSTLPVVTGGDRLLLRDTVAAMQARGIRPVLASRRLAVPDPRRRVLDEAARAACAVRVRVQEAPGRPPASGRQ